MNTFSNYVSQNNVHTLRKALSYVNVNQYATLIEDNIKHTGIKSDVLRYFKSEDLGVTKNTRSNRSWFDEECKYQKYLTNNNYFEAMEEGIIY